MRGLGAGCNGVELKCFAKYSFSVLKRSFYAIVDTMFS